MKARIGKGLEYEFPRSFAPTDADLGDAARVEALFDQLERDPLKNRDQLLAWLRKWSELTAAVSEEESLRYIKMTCQTDDPERERAYLDFVENISPRVKPRQFALTKKYLESPARKGLDRDRYFVFNRSAETEVRLFRDENVPLQTEERKLSQQYQKLTGAMTVEYEGREQTLQQMARYLEFQDRGVRKEAWGKVVERRLADRKKLDELFDRMLELRARIAKNAGFENYRDYAFLDRHRFDYGVADCERFHRSVEEVVVPLHRELQKKRRGEMKLDSLRPWDLRPDPQGRPPLKPFTCAEELVAGCQKIYDRLDPALGGWFKFMSDHELLDLESRKGKAPGAYSCSLEELRYPFIFSNAVGVDHDVETMLHECGHAFHTFSSREEPLVFYRHAPLEFCEVASMSMEFLGGDHLEAFYSQEDKHRSRTSHLEGVISIFCWIAAVDAFQHWLYTHPGHTATERAEAWTSLRRRFGGIEDYTGYEEAREHDWQRQLHIFVAPFYYIEYGIAELGALQVWKRSREEGAAALRDYRAALALGGSRPLPELFSAAGVKFDMGRATLEPLVQEVKKTLDEGGR